MNSPSFSSSLAAAGASSAAVAAPPAAGAAAPPEAAPPDGTEASLAEPAAISCKRCQVWDSVVCSAPRSISYLVDVLALELGDELVETLAIGLNSNGREDRLDVGGRGLLVASELEEEVSCDVLHFDGVFRVWSDPAR